MASELAEMNVLSGVPLNVLVSTDETEIKQIYRIY